MGAENERARAPSGEPPARRRSGWRSGRRSVSGVTAVIALLAVGALALVAAWAGGHSEVEAQVGYVTLGAFGLAILGVVSAPQLAAHPAARGAGRLFGPVADSLGWLFSLVDRALVIGVAGLCGGAIHDDRPLNPPIIWEFVKTRRAKDGERTLIPGLKVERWDIGLFKKGPPAGWAHRLFWLSVNLAIAAYVGWRAPAPWGLAGLLWGFLVAVAIARRWSWIEDDREHAMLSREFDPEKNPNIEIGFEQNLRGAALIGILSFLLFIPLGLRQLDLAFDLFQHADGNTSGYLQWFGFFGVEIAKALPFVDWAEAYAIDNGSGIVARGANGHHAVFVAKAVVDVLLLGALMQAIDAIRRENRQRDMFWRGELPVLDPFLEPREFGRLVRTRNVFGPEGVVEDVTSLDELPEDPNVFPKAFVEYDDDRLERIAKDERLSDAVRALALKLLYLRGDASFCALAGEIMRTQAHGDDASTRLGGAAAAMLAALAVRRDESGAGLKAGAVAQMRAALRLNPNDKSFARSYLVRKQLVHDLADIDAKARGDDFVQVIQHDTRSVVREEAVKSAAHANPSDWLRAVMAAVAERKSDNTRLAGVRGLSDLAACGEATELQRQSAIERLKTLARDRNRKVARLAREKFEQHAEHATRPAPEPAEPVDAPADDDALEPA